MTTYQITATAVTTASPDQVWAVLDDFSGWPKWMPAMKDIAVDVPADEPLGPGYRFRLRSGLVHTDMKVVQYQPLERVTTFRISFPPFTGTNRCQIVPLDDGRYRLERSDSLDVPRWFANFLDATQKARFEKLALEFLLALKQTVEQRVDHDQPTR